MTSAILALLLALPAATFAQGDPDRKSRTFPQGPAEQAREGRPGPWDRDVIVYHVARSGEVEPVARFERAGVPTITRLADGRLIAAHQHFPADLGQDFDKVAVRFSSNEGRAWSA